MKRMLVALVLVGAAASPAAAQMHGNRSVEVALRMEGGRLLVPVRAADGTELEFMLSTGTPATVFSESTAALLGQDAGLTIGGLPLDMVAFSTVPDEALTADGMVLAGMVGPNTFNDYDILVDAPGGRLLLKPFGRSVAWEGMTMSDPVPLRVYHGEILALDVELNGRPYGAQLDLGLSTIVINEPLQTAMQLEAEGVGTLRLGATTFSDVPVRVRDLQAFEMWDPDGAGFVVVGAPIARDCAIAISWVHQEMRTCVR